MTSFKEKNGEYLVFDDLKIKSIDWYTNGNHDCSLDVTDGEHSYNHGDGKLWQKYTIKNGKPHGEWKIYHPNGKVSIDEEYDNGLKVGC